MSDCDFGRPLPNQDLESRAQNFESSLEANFKDSNWNQGRILTRLAAERFIQDTLKLDGSGDKHEVFARAQQLNDSAICKGNPMGLPAINVVFGDFDNSGLRDQLTEFNLIERTSQDDNAISVRLDLYHR